MLTNYDTQCSGTKEKPHIQFFRFIEDLHPPAPPQTPLYTASPQLTLTTSSQQHAVGKFQGQCAVLGCAKPRVNVKCVRTACATHCRALGGCPVNLHQHGGTVLMPSSTQSFETASMLPWSQAPLVTFSVPTPTFPPLRIMSSLPSVPVSILTASSSIDQPISMPDEQPPLYLASTSVNPGEAPRTFSPEPPSPMNLLLANPSEVPSFVSPFPTRIVAQPPSSMNPLPNPRFASQMRPIFTDQSKREQEMRENVHVVEEQHLAAIKMVNTALSSMINADHTSSLTTFQHASTSCSLRTQLEARNLTMLTGTREQH